MTKETFAKASKVVDKPSNVKIDIRLCTNHDTLGSDTVSVHI